MQQSLLPPSSFFVHDLLERSGLAMSAVLDTMSHRSSSSGATDQMPARQASQRRARKACDRCNQLRAKCDGGEPCNRCIQSQVPCEFARTMKKRGKPSKVELARRAALRAGQTGLDQVPTAGSAAAGAAATGAPSGDMSMAGPGPLPSRPPLDDREGGAGPSSAYVNVPGSDIHDSYSDLKDLPSLDQVLPHALIRPGQRLPGGSGGGGAGNSSGDQLYEGLTMDHTLYQHDIASLQHTELKYPVLLPLVPYLVSVVPLPFACELLEYYFSSSSLVCPHPNSPYVIGFMFSKHSFLSQKTPRLYSPALLASMLWIASRTSDAIYFDESPSVRERVSRKLLNLTIRLLQPLVHGSIPRGHFNHGIVEPPEIGTPTGMRGRGSSESLDDVATYMHIGTVVSASEYKSSSLRWWNAAWALAVEQQLYRELPPDSGDEHGLVQKDEQMAERLACREVEREERRRVWWLLFLIDRHLSFCYNKPLALSDRDCQDLLQPVDEYRWQNGEMSDHVTDDPLQPITISRSRQRGPPVEFSGPCLFGYYLPLMVILGEVIELIHARNHPRLGQACVEAQFWDEQARTIGIRLNAFEQSLRMFDAESSELAQQIFYEQGVSASTLPQDEKHEASTRRVMRRQVQQKKAIAYSNYVVHVLHNLLIGKCDPISLFDDQDYWISSPSFVDATTHAIHAADAIARILEFDPDMSTIPWLFGIELLHGSFLLLLIIDKLKTDAATNVITACEIMVRAHEACAFTLNTEYQRKFRRVMRSAIAEARGYAPDEAGDEQKRRREVLSLYRWNQSGTGLAL